MFGQHRNSDPKESRDVSATDRREVRDLVIGWVT
jgi:hypothetical protein